jgi:hypothetical protein
MSNYLLHEQDWTEWQWVTSREKAEPFPFSLKKTPGRGIRLRCSSRTV